MTGQEKSNVPWPPEPRIKILTEWMVIGEGLYIPKSVITSFQYNPDIIT